MPQMMPINWILLFFFFIFIFIIFNVMNYYMYLTKFQSNNLKNFKKNKLIWKW